MLRSSTISAARVFVTSPWGDNYVRASARGDGQGKAGGRLVAPVVRGARRQTARHDRPPSACLPAPSHHLPLAPLSLAAEGLNSS